MTHIRLSKAWTSADAHNESGAPDIQTARHIYPPGPGWGRALFVIGSLALVTWVLSTQGRGSSSTDPQLASLGKIEVTAQLVKCPDAFPDLGDYRYTYVVEYRVLKVHRQDPAGKHLLKSGDRIFVGHYKPRLPRSQIKDDDWGDALLGGKLDRIVQNDVHRMALDYDLQALAPSGALDYCYPPHINRFFAVWTNPATP